MGGRVDIKNTQMLTEQPPFYHNYGEISHLYINVCCKTDHQQMWLFPTLNNPVLPTLRADFTGPNKVALVAHQDDGCLWLGLPEKEAELGGAVETSSVSH